MIWNDLTAGKATGGNSTCPWEASGISFDTRTIKKGDLFVAISGERDGHDFVETAFKNGASAAMVSHIPEDVDERHPILVVEDVKQALVRLATVGRERRRRGPGPRHGEGEQGKGS